MNFSKTLPLVDFIVSQGASKLDIIRNPKNGKRFFTVPGTDVSGRVADKVEKLSAELSVSWFTPTKPDADGNIGEPSYMVHTTGSTNVEDSFTL